MNLKEYPLFFTSKPLGSSALFLSLLGLRIVINSGQSKPRRLECNIQRSLLFLKAPTHENKEPSQLGHFY